MKQDIVVTDADVRDYFESNRDRFIAEDRRRVSHILILIDGEVTHTVRKIPVAGDYRVQDDHGASDEPCILEPEELELCHRVCKLVSDSLDWHGKWRGQPLLYARVDLLRGLDGQCVVNELELVEPSLFLRHGPQAAGKLVRALQRRLEA